MKKIFKKKKQSKEKSIIRFLLMNPITVKVKHRSLQKNYIRQGGIFNSLIYINFWYSS